ncbi:MAG: aminopeptidase [Candidatus Edwardsbacteria bacterium]|jgi:leucyl aminopeptidase (aminopeptidase T)|nr:aminopeptidase [Candidatus Edwardsbacteria bacterium]
MNDIQRSLAVAFTDCLGVKPRETVLVVTDEGRLALGMAIRKASLRYARESLLAVMPVRANNGQEPPPAVAAMMRGADAILLATTRSLSHTQARERATAAGARIASMPGATAAMLRRTLAVDHRGLQRLCDRIIPRLSGARTVRITTARGTDLTFSLRGRTARPDHGIIRGPGGFTNLPAGEVYVAPLEGTASGRLVIDGSVLQARVRRPIAVAVAGGVAVGVGPGREASRLWRELARHGRAGLNVAEFGIGINPAARITGNVLEDEKVLGTVHIAFGDNSHFGGLVRVPSHQDGIVKAPTVTIDGRTLIDEGKLQL